MNPLSKIKRLDIRDIWPSEQSDFTPWLGENIEELGRAIGIEMENLGRELGVGDFSLDLLAKDLGTGALIVVENQFGRTDHDHLGKLITYSSGFGAKIIVWVAEEFREEHRQALEWLNQITDTESRFFGVSAEILQIDDSSPALEFRPVVMPNEWGKSKRSHGEATITPKQLAYKEFFHQLIGELREEHQFTSAKVAFPQNWYSFAAGISGVAYGVNFAQERKVRAELYISLGDQDSNKRLFDKLFANKKIYEESFGADLNWERMDNKITSRIAIYRPGSIDESSETLKELHEWLIANLLRMKNVFSKEELRKLAIK